MPNSGPPLQLSYWFVVYSISSRKRCSEKKCNQYHVCFADQKNISDSMTWKILMQPIIFCGVANLVEETEMIFFPWQAKQYMLCSRVKPSLSMKILSINDFITKLLSKLLGDVYIGVHLKGTKKFGSK